MPSPMHWAASTSTCRRRPSACGRCCTRNLARTPTRNAEMDVAIIGCGPVGALLGNLLGAEGLSVDIYDREHDVYPLPRAVHFDGEIMRIFQAAGLANEIK